MRKGILLFLAVVVFLLAAAGAAFLGGIFVSQGTEAPENGVALQEAEAEPSDFEAVNAAVRTFGERLQSVSLQAPADQLRADIIEQYAEYVSPKLLSEWVLDPSLAPGRLTSSPWPESIEVSDSAEAEGAWRVKGYVLLRTSADLASGGAAVRLPIELTLEKEGDRWLIAQVVFNQSVLFEVPFSPQAPFANWLDSRQNYGCEETSALMAVKWARGEELTPEEAEEIIVEAAEWQIKHYGEFHDTSAKDTVDRLLKGYFGYQNAQLQSGIAVHHIKQALWDGNIVIVPVRGRELQNPYYTPPGPLIHMVVVAGYDGTSGEFIVNDPGTRRGAKIRYEENLFVAAIRDYASGHNEPLQDSEKVMIVVSPEAGG